MIKEPPQFDAIKIHPCAAPLSAPHYPWGQIDAQRMYQAFRLDAERRGYSVVKKDLVYNVKAVGVGSRQP